jgi:acyl CoA:acetate/3-ketoacid CoA transferase beta subunit
MVKSVSLATMGAHPFSLAYPGMEKIQGYETDIEFLDELHRAVGDRDKHDAWMRKWVLDCPTWDEYKARLGHSRVAGLQYIRKKRGSICAGIPGCKRVKRRASDEDLMLLAAAKEIEGSIIRNGYKLILTGAGSRAVAALIAYDRLKEKFELALITGNGQLGYEPQPGEISTQSIASIYSSRMLTDTVISHGVFVGGTNSSCLSVIGAGQIDRYGNINSTLTSDGEFLVGSGGANDSINAPEVILIMNQERDRFVEKLPYITGSGRNVSTVISTMGVFKKLHGAQELKLVACLPCPEMPGLKDRIERVRQNCGWPLKLSGHIQDIKMPAAKDLKLLDKMVRSPLHM